MSRRKKLLVRTATGGTLLAVLLGLLWWTHRANSGWPVLAVGAPLAFLAAFELSRMGKLGKRLTPMALLAAVPLAAGVVAHQLNEGHAASSATVAGALLAAAVTSLMAPGKERKLQLACQLWVATPLLLLVTIHARHGVLGLSALLLLSKIGDIAGYYFGQAFGKHHPFPKLSPGKTTEGCTASFAAAVILGAVLHLAFDWGVGGEWGLVGALAAAGLTNLASQGGDLIESAAKRSAGVKDSSGWVGASGGVLDVVDSLLLSVPVALLTWPLLAP